VARKARDEGILARPLPYVEVISFSPALCITVDDVNEAVEAFGRALDKAMPDLTRFAKP